MSSIVDTNNLNESNLLSLNCGAKMTQTLSTSSSAEHPLAAITSTPLQSSTSQSYQQQSTPPPQTSQQQQNASLRRDTYKDRRKTYRMEKKKVAEELMSTLCDPTVVVLADWLK